MIDVKRVKEEAEKEIRDEKMKAAKERIKALLRKRDQAEVMLKNIERELADGYAELGE